MLRRTDPTHPLLGSASIRRIEARALAATAPGELMARAAQAVADAAERHLRARAAGCAVWAFCGPGNNGGDALIAARLLQRRGFDARAFELGDAAAPRRGQAGQAGLQATRIGSPEALRALLGPFEAQPARAPLVLDGLFGIGLSRALGGLAAQLCRQLDASGMPVIAIDVPSGIDADTGAVVGGPSASAIRALETVTMIADKPGLHTGRAVDHVGRVQVAPLGLDPDAGNGSHEPSAPCDGELFGRRAAAWLLPGRPRDSSKGSYGSVLVIGGAQGMSGAALLAGLGAQRSGAGKVWIATPGEPVFDPGQPQLMTRDVDASFEFADVLVAGCGLGTTARAAGLLDRVLASLQPAVLDADALNLLAARPDKPPASAGPRVLTPHPLEAARLAGCQVAEVQADRIGAACSLARERDAVVVLKGAGTVVAAADGRWAIIGSGGPALASAGTGDVLAGLIGGLIAQGLSCFDAARLACWAHGHAGDRWADEQGSSAGLSAAELPVLVRASLASLGSLQPAHHKAP